MEISCASDISITSFFPVTGLTEHAGISKENERISIKNLEDKKIPLFILAGLIQKCFQYFSWVIKICNITKIIVLMNM